MTSFLRRLDPGLLITVALCALTLWPLLARPGLPNGDDVLYHVYRAAEMDRAWSHGVLFPRWAETFYTGYGAPVFHYYASLTYYLTSLLTRLFGTDAVNSLRILIALCSFMAGAGMYLFSRRYAGLAGGVLAALVYVYSPYLLFTEPYSRGAYPELLAFALFPLVMWRYNHLIDTGKPGAFAIAALSSGALIVAHNLMALVLTGLLIAWIGWGFIAEALRKQNAKTQRDKDAKGFYSTSPRLCGSILLSSSGTGRYIAALLAVIVGIGLAAYFWIPVFSEGQAVKLANLTGTAELNYRNFFVPGLHLFDSAPRQDAGAFNGLEHQLSLGTAQWVLAVMGVVGAIIVFSHQSPVTSQKLSAISYQLPASNHQHIDREPRTQHSALSTILFFSLLGLTFILLITTAGAVIWQAVAPMAFLQFPWRLIGPAVFCLAVLAGMNTHWLERLPGWIRTTLTAGMILFIVGSASPLLYVPEWTHESIDTSVAAYHEQELKGFQRATTFSNEYLPVAVSVEPGATPRLLADYADGYPINKVHKETLPQGVTVEPLEHGPQHDVWRVRASTPFTMEVLTYDFLGWTADIDGQTVPITPSDPHGLITFPVPAGDHQVRVYLGSTPARDLGNAISLVSLVVLVVVSVVRQKSKVESRKPETAEIHTLHVTHHTQHSQLLPLIMGGILSFTFLLLYIKEGGAWVNSPPGQALLAQHQTDYRLGDSIRLIGYDLNNTTFRPGDRIELKVYWYTTTAIPYGYSSFVHVSMGGPPLAQADKLNPAGLPTKIWPSTGYIHDDYVIDLPATIPPGEYSLVVGLYTCDTRPVGECGNGERLIVTDSGSKALGDVVLLAQLKVE